MTVQRRFGGGITDPELSLAAAVVQQAWDDMLREVSTRNNETNKVHSVDRAQALRFCCDAGGEWAVARMHWCLAAGIDPDVFRERAMARRNGAGAAAPNGSAGMVLAEVAGDRDSLGGFLPNAGLPPATCAAGASASAAAFLGEAA